MPLARVLRNEAVVLAASLKRDLAELSVEQQVLQRSSKTGLHIERLGQIASEMQKAGYVKEGHLRQSAIKNGKIRDQILFATYKKL